MCKGPLDYSLSLSDRLARSSAQLFQHTPIVAFGYIKIFASGEMLHLSSNKVWLETCYHNNIFDCPNYFIYALKAVELNKFGFVVRTGAPKDIVQTSAQNFGFLNSLIVSRKNSSYVELFAFHAPEILGVIDLYINHTHLFKKFALHFLDDFHSAISFDNNTMLHRLKEVSARVKELFVFEKEISENVDTLHSVAPFKRLYIDDKFYITLRQAQCIALIMQGKSAKETARALGISFKTVEHTLEAIKNVFGINNKSDLASLVIKNDLQDIFLKDFVRFCA